MDSLTFLSAGTGTTPQTESVGRVEGTGSGFVPLGAVRATALVLISAGVFFAGSVGIATTHTEANWKGVAPATGAQPIRDHRYTPRSTSELLVEIKAVLGISVTQLSEVLHVTRQIVYKWLSERNDSTLQGKNQERLDKIHELAQEWQRLSNRPLGKDGRTLRVAGNKSLLDLLSAEVIDEVQIKEAMSVLSVRLSERHESAHNSSATVQGSREGLAVYSRTVGASSEDDET